MIDRTCEISELCDVRIRSTDLGVVSARFAGCTRESVVVVVGLLVEPGLDAGTHSLTEVAVDVQVLTEFLVAERRRAERRLTVLELALISPRLSQLRQLAVPALYATALEPGRIGSEAPTSWGTGRLPHKQKSMGRGPTVWRH